MPRTTSPRATSHSATLTLKRRLFPFGYSLSFTAVGPLTFETLPKLIDGICERVLPREIFSKGLLLDMKGGAGLGAGGPGGAPLKLDQRDELFSYDGTFIPSNEDQDEEECWARVTTPFASFKGGSHIEHSVVKETSPLLNESLSSSTALASLEKLLPLTPKRVRCGIEFFAPTPVVLLGFAPTVRSSFSLEGSLDGYRLQIAGQGLSRKEVDELLLTPEIEPVVRMCEDRLQISIMDRYRDALAEQK